MKLIILSLISVACVSCSQMQLAPQAKSDLRVATMACTVESFIIKDESKLPAFQKASDILSTIIKNDAITRAELETKLTEALDKVFSANLTKAVVSEIMDIYDKSMSNIQGNDKLMLALKSTKSALDSGIQLSVNKTRPIRVLPGL